MTSLDEAEYQRLQTAIGDAERVFGSDPRLDVSAATPKVETDKKRVHVLEQEGLFGSSEQDKKNSSSAQAIAIAALVARESALSHEERQTYASFLHKEYFTRDDINALEEFYRDGEAYDRLSKKGKEEMAIRLLEGVQRGEVSMDEVSPTIQKKQGEQLHSMMTNSEEMHPRIAAIPKTQRDNFVREYEAGNVNSAHKILSSSSPALESSHGKTQTASVRRSETIEHDENVKTDKTESGTKEVEERERSQSDDSFFSSLSDADEISAPSNLPQSPSVNSR